MKKILASLSFLLLTTALSHAYNGIKLLIYNESGSEVWLQWTGQPAGGLQGTSTNGINIATSDFNSNAAGYQLSTLGGPSANVYEIDNFKMQGGRMWFTEGPAGFIFNNAGYTPPYGTFSDANFTTRFDKLEAFIFGSTDDNLDMTAVDAFSIPFEIIAYNSGNPSTTTQHLRGSTTAKIVNALMAATQNGSPYLNINSNSLGATNPPATLHSPVGTTGSFVRVVANDGIITPLNNDQVVVSNGGTIPTQYLYQNYALYLAKMDGTGASPYTGTTSIKGPFAGVGGQMGAIYAPQSYNLTAAFNAIGTMTMISPATGQSTTYTNGVVTLTGSATVVGNLIIQIPYQLLLLPTGIVGANAGYAYSFDGGKTFTGTGTAGPQNNILTWIEGDLLAGMNVGTVGSTTPFPGGALGGTGTNYAAGTPVGAIASGDWWYLGAFLAKPGESVYDYYYGYLQSSPQFYNAYSATLYPLTDAYGYAYGDRLQKGSVAVSWNSSLPNAVDTLEVHILSDGTGFNGGAPNDPNAPITGGSASSPTSYQNIAFAGNIYDIVLLNSPAVTVNAKPGHITRVAFIDPTDNIDFLEFSGPGTATVTMNSPIIRPPVDYNQSGLNYAKGLASVTVDGANAATYVSLYALGTEPTRVDPSLVTNPAAIDGIARAQSMAFTNTTAIGGINLADTQLVGSSGQTGFIAPGLLTAGFVYLSNLNADSAGQPVLQFAPAAQIAIIAGNNFQQTNNQVVQCSGVRSITFTSTTSATGVTTPAGANAGVFFQNGVNVTSQIVHNN